MSDYTFHTLSSGDFEDLVGDLLNAEYDLRLHGYPAGRDQGIDLLWERPGYRIVVQCKHYRRTDRSKLLAAAEAETKKPGYRRADRYIFVTSSDITNETEQELERILRIPQHDVWGRWRINDALGRHPDVERRNFKLWLSSTNMLRSVLDSGRQNRAAATLGTAAEHAMLWVETPAYRRALDVLKQAGVCVLTGPPGVGKSHLAEMIALRYAQKGWPVVDMTGDIKGGWRELGPEDGPRLFLLRDPLGEVDLSSSDADDAGRLQEFVQAVNRRRNRSERLMITTPTQVLRSAILTGTPSLQRFARAERYQCEISLDDWDEEARKRLLLNHLEFAEVDEDERYRVERDQRSVSIVRHRSFNPRLIEMVCADFTAETSADHALDELMRALADPEIVWHANWAKLTEEASDVLFTLASLKPRPVSLDELRDLASKEPVTGMRWQKVWQSLQPIWIKVEGPPTARTVTLANPGIRDFLLGRLFDVDLAADLVGRARTLEQLEELSRAAGHLVAGVRSGPSAERTGIAHALRRAGPELARRIRAYAEADLDRTSFPATLRVLRTAVALLGLYDGPGAIDWIGARVFDVLPVGASVPVAEGLALAVRIRRLAAGRERDELVERLRSGALVNVRYLDDLDALETYAADLGLDLTEVDVPVREIMTTELDHLLDETDSRFIRNQAYELRERAGLYGMSLDIREQLAHATDIESD